MSVTFSCSKCGAPRWHYASCPLVKVGREFKKPIVLAKDNTKPQPKKKRRSMKGRR